MPPRNESAVDQALQFIDILSPLTVGGGSALGLEAPVPASASSCMSPLKPPCGSAPYSSSPPPYPGPTMLGSPSTPRPSTPPGTPRGALLPSPSPCQAATESHAASAVQLILPFADCYNVNKEIYYIGIALTATLSFDGRAQARRVTKENEKKLDNSGLGYGVKVSELTGQEKLQLLKYLAAVLPGLSPGLLPQVNRQVPWLVYVAKAVKFGEDILVVLSGSDNCTYNFSDSGIAGEKQECSYILIEKGEFANFASVAAFQSEFTPQFVTVDRQQQISEIIRQIRMLGQYINVSIGGGESGASSSGHAPVSPSVAGVNSAIAALKEVINLLPTSGEVDPGAIAAIVGNVEFLLGAVNKSSGRDAVAKKEKLYSLRTLLATLQHLLDKKLPQIKSSSFLEQHQNLRRQSLIWYNDTARDQALKSAKAAAQDKLALLRSSGRLPGDFASFINELLDYDRKIHEPGWKSMLRTNSDRKAQVSRVIGALFSDDFSLTKLEEELDRIQKEIAKQWQYNGNVKKAARRSTLCRIVTGMLNGLRQAVNPAQITALLRSSLYYGSSLNPFLLNFLSKQEFSLRNLRELLKTSENIATVYQALNLYLQAKIDGTICNPQSEKLANVLIKIYDEADLKERRGINVDSLRLNLFELKLTNLLGENYQASNVDLIMGRIKENWSKELHQKIMLIIQNGDHAFFSKIQTFIQEYRVFLYSSLDRTEQLNELNSCINKVSNEHALSSVCKEFNASGNVPSKIIATFKYYLEFLDPIYPQIEYLEDEKNKWLGTDTPISTKLGEFLKSLLTKTTYTQDGSGSIIEYTQATYESIIELLNTQPSPPLLAVAKQRVLDSNSLAIDEFIKNYVTYLIKNEQHEKIKELVLQGSVVMLKGTKEEIAKIIVDYIFNNVDSSVCVTSLIEWVKKERDSRGSRQISASSASAGSPRAKGKIGKARRETSAEIKGKKRKDYPIARIEDPSDGGVSREDPSQEQAPGNGAIQVGLFIVSLVLNMKTVITDRFAKCSNTELIAFLGRKNVQDIMALAPEEFKKLLDEQTNKLINDFLGGLKSEEGKYKSWSAPTQEQQDRFIAFLNQPFITITIGALAYSTGYDSSRGNLVAAAKAFLEQEDLSLEDLDKIFNALAKFSSPSQVQNIEVDIVPVLDAAANKILQKKVDALLAAWNNLAEPKNLQSGRLYQDFVNLLTQPIKVVNGSSYPQSYDDQTIKQIKELVEKWLTEETPDNLEDLIKALETSSLLKVKDAVVSACLAVIKTQLSSDQEAEGAPCSDQKAEGALYALDRFKDGISEDLKKTKQKLINCFVFVDRLGSDEQKKVAQDVLGTALVRQYLKNGLIAEAQSLQDWYAFVDELIATLKICPVILNSLRTLRTSKHDHFKGICYLAELLGNSIFPVLVDGASEEQKEQYKTKLQVKAKAIVKDFFTAPTVENLSFLDALRSIVAVLEYYQLGVPDFFAEYEAKIQFNDSVKNFRDKIKFIEDSVRFSQQLKAKVLATVAQLTPIEVKIEQGKKLAVILSDNDKEAYLAQLKEKLQELNPNSGDSWLTKISTQLGDLFSKLVITQQDIDAINTEILSYNVRKELVTFVDQIDGTDDEAVIRMLAELNKDKYRQLIATLVDKPTDEGNALLEKIRKKKISGYVFNRSVLNEITDAQVQPVAGYDNLLRLLNPKTDEEQDKKYLALLNKIKETLDKSGDLSTRIQQYAGGETQLINDITYLLLYADSYHVVELTAFLMQVCTDNKTPQVQKKANEIVAKIFYEHSKLALYHLLSILKPTRMWSDLYDVFRLDVNKCGLSDIEARFGYALSLISPEGIGVLMNFIERQASTFFRDDTMRQVLTTLVTGCNLLRAELDQKLSGNGQKDSPVVNGKIAVINSLAEKIKEKLLPTAEVAQQTSASPSDGGVDCSFNPAACQRQRQNQSSGIAVSNASIHRGLGADVAVAPSATKQTTVVAEQQKPESEPPRSIPSSTADYRGYLAGTIGSTLCQQPPSIKNPPISFDLPLETLPAKEVVSGLEASLLVIPPLKWNDTVDSCFDGLVAFLSRMDLSKEITGENITELNKLIASVYCEQLIEIMQNAVSVAQINQIEEVYKGHVDLINKYPELKEELVFVRNKVQLLDDFSEKLKKDPLGCLSSVRYILEGKEVQLLPYKLRILFTLLELYVTDEELFRFVYSFPGVSGVEVFGSNGKQPLYHTSLLDSLKDTLVKMRQQRIRVDAGFYFRLLKLKVAHPSRCEKIEELGYSDLFNGLPKFMTTTQSDGWWPALLGGQEGVKTILESLAKQVPSKKPPLPFTSSIKMGETEKQCTFVPISPKDVIMWQSTVEENGMRRLIYEPQQKCLRYIQIEVDANRMCRETQVSYQLVVAKDRRREVKSVRATTAAVTKTYDVPAYIDWKRAKMANMSEEEKISFKERCDEFEKDLPQRVLAQIALALFSPGELQRSDPVPIPGAT